MKTLVVGGTGFAGGYTALYLRKLGWDVTIMGRKPPPAGTALAQLPFQQGDYLAPEFPDTRLHGFDAMIFAAGADITRLPGGDLTSPKDFYYRCNTVGMPAFFRKAKAAGIGRVVNLGSFYAHVAPAEALADPYVASRAESCKRVRALSDDCFAVCAVNAPFILGTVPDLPVAHLSAIKAYVMCQIPGAPQFAPQGGTNHVTLLTVAEALRGALERGEAGKAYLIGDANYSWKEYLESWAQACGIPREYEVRGDIDHPLIPFAIMYAGIGSTVSYQVDREEQVLLGYGQGRMEREISACAEHY